MPPGACGVLVKEDFLDIPLGTGRGGQDGLLLDSLYVALASPAGGGSSNLILHVRLRPACHARSFMTVLGAPAMHSQ